MAVGDIASEGFSLRELFTEVSYDIDFYQRDYTWGEEEVRILLRDLCRAFDGWSQTPDLRLRAPSAPQYFLGPFVYHERRQGHRFLVDGQQRFVTLHLIFLHLRFLVKSLGDDRSVDRLNRVISRHDGKFCIAIPDHEPVLRAISAGREYEPGHGDSLSRRNLWARSREIEPLLEDDLDADRYRLFIEWLLDRVALVGIRAASRDHGYQMFETMNERGARLTPVDLLKSYLLSNVGTDQEKLNDEWRRMLSELTTDRSDPLAPARFIKAVLLARHARPGVVEDRESIDRNLNAWVRKNNDHLGLVHGEGERFFRFARELVDLARLFRPMLAASRELKPEFEAIFFNEKNGLDAQMVALLAAIQPDDTPTEAKEKARCIAGFIDRWYVLQVLEDLPVQPYDIEELVHDDLVPRLRNCRDSSQVTEVLRRFVTAETSSIADFTTFGLRGNNRRQVRYILARITAHVEVALNRAVHVATYLDGDKYHIEHLWADHHDRVRSEIPDPVVFRTRRNQLGALGLLPGSDNSSINDMPFQEKVELYARHNALLGVLASTFNERNKTLRDFVRKNGLEQLLRRFGTNTAMTEVVETRQQLYLRLCAMVWDPARLGLVETRDAIRQPGRQSRASQNPSDRPDARRKAKRRTHVALMLSAGVLEAGTEIVLAHSGVDHWASIGADGGIVLRATGHTYDKADEAGRAVRGTRCNGMAEWHVVQADGGRTSLAALREHARATGRLPRTRARQPPRGRTGT